MFFPDLFSSFSPAFQWLLNLWWIWLPFFLWLMFESLWMNYIQSLYKMNASWAFLEIQMPREIRKSPKAMEQVFATIHGLRNAPNDPLEKYWDGEVTLWFSLEIISLGGEIHFYIRSPLGRKNLVEAGLYAQYPDLRIVEAEDYAQKMFLTTKDLYANNYDLWGTELVLAKESTYPIKTYVEFENIAEEKELDPISALLEVLNKAKKQEVVWIQILIRPLGSEWKKKGDALIQKLKAEQTEVTGGVKGKELTRIFTRTPGETEVLKYIENKLSKPSFESLIRYIYFAPKSDFNSTFPRRGVAGAFNQYAAQNINYFATNYATRTMVRWIYWPHIFCKRRLEARKQRILKNYQKRKMPEETVMGRVFNTSVFNSNLTSKTFILNTEELATLFHPPSFVVLTSPLIKEVESKTLGPAAGLPIFGSKEELPDELK